MSFLGCPLLFTLVISVSSITAEQVAAPPTEKQEKPEETLLRLTNNVRAEKKLEKLVLNPLLSKASEWLAKDMAEHNYFSHEDRLKRQPDARVEAFGYQDWTSVCENIVGGASTAEEAFRMWMKSPGHRKNILDPEVREMGFGYASNPKSKYLKYWVQNFGARR